MRHAIRVRGRTARGRRGAALGLAGAALLVMPGAAHAGWGAPQLASVDNGRLEQADGASSAVDVSGDGRWVVFQTRATNFFADDDPDAPGRLRQGGVFRFDRTTGAIALVADGDEVDLDSGELLRRGAAAPSVSDDGRFVVFSSAQRLVPQDENDNVDVYVRDMALPIGTDRAASGAYALVSARDGGEQPAQYEPRDPPLPGRTPGSAVFAGQAISGDGRYVAFRTVEQRSDLPAGGVIETPPGSVFVRDLQAKRTVLVSRTLDGAGSAGGALPPVVLSRDGSTVAWVGQNAPAQTRMLEGEGSDASLRYHLWRRWDDPGAVTRRVTGMVDLDDPACSPDARVAIDPSATGPCYGPLTDRDAGASDIGGAAPALSADGWTVAFLSGAGARPSAAEDLFLDAYVTSMRPGVSRKAGTRTVTKGTTGSNVRANGDVESVALSADGTRLALVTVRRELLPPAPPLFGDARASQPSTGSELYVVDLAGGASAAGATRRVLAPGGDELDGSVAPNPAMSADGRVIAFATAAGNLVPGDANEQADAFAVEETPDRQGAPPPVGLGEDQIDLDVGSEGDEFGARVTARRDGTLLVRASVPEAGALRAVASTRPQRAAARARASRGGGRRAAPRRATRPRQGASVRGRAPRRATVRLVLRLKGRDLRAVRRGTPLPVRVVVTLRPARAGARTRTTVSTARFRVVPRRAPREAGRRPARRAGRRAPTRP